MSRWFRMYDDAMDDPKVQLLSDKSFRGWFKILCIASKYDGVLPPLRELSYRLRMTDEKTSALLNELYAARLIDEVEVEGAPMSYTPHNWRSRQFKSDTTDPTAAERMKRFRKRNGDRNDTVTATPTRAETEQKQILGADAPTPISKSKRASTAVPDGFALDDAMRRFAGDRGFVGVNVERMFERFLNHHRAKGSRFVDWQAAWRTWVGNQVQFDAQRNLPGQRRVPDV